MNPILIKVSDSFTHTKCGDHNLWNVNSGYFNVDVVHYNINPVTLRCMVRLAFEHLGSPTWPIDMAIYSVPLKLAASLDIPLVVYGENVAFEYGGPNVKETYSARGQIKNDVVKPVDWDWWKSKGITESEYSFFKYPSFDLVDFPRFWKELDDWPIERVLSAEGLAEYGDTFGYLVGEPRRWMVS